MKRFLRPEEFDKRLRVCGVSLVKINFTHPEFPTKEKERRGVHQAVTYGEFRGRNISMAGGNI